MTAPICDFCSSPDVRYWYPCRDFVVVMPPPVAHDHVSEGAWAACETCAALVDAGDRRGLSARSWATYRVKHPELEAMPPPAASLTRHLMTGLHAGFWAERYGERRDYVEPGPVTCPNCGAPASGPPRGPCAHHGTATATYD